MGGLGGVTIPGLMIGFNDGALLEATDGVTGAVGSSIVISLADRIAGFSSRGPNGAASEIVMLADTCPQALRVTEFTVIPEPENRTVALGS